jgi:hypothetical protein
VGRDGSKWPKRNKNRNSWRWAANGGLDWPGAIAANSCSVIKIGIPQCGATNGGLDWLGTMAENGCSAIKLEFSDTELQMVAWIG